MSALDVKISYQFSCKQGHAVAQSMCTFSGTSQNLHLCLENTALSALERTRNWAAVARLCKVTSCSDVIAHFSGCSPKRCDEDEQIHGAKSM